MNHLKPFGTILLATSLWLLTCGCQTTQPSSAASPNALPFTAGNFLELGTGTVDQMRTALANHRAGRVDRALPLYHKAYRRADQLERAGGPERDSVKIALEHLIADAYVRQAETVARDPQASESDIHRAISRLEESIALNPADESAFRLWEEMDAWWSVRQ